MPRKGHYLKTTGRGTTPGLIVSVVVQERTVGGEESDPRCRVREFHHASVAWSSHGRTGWTHARTLRFGTTDSFWRWLDELGPEGRRAYVFAPIASDVLTLLGFWGRVHAPDSHGGRGNRRAQADDTGDAAGRRLRLSRLVLCGRPDVVAYGVDGRTFVWLSGRQFWDYSSRELAALFPAGPGVPGVRGEGGGRLTTGGTAEALVWMRAIRSFADWWAGLGAGPFPRTLPGGAMQFFRSRMPARSIVVHRDEEPYRLERAACHGGRASCWYYGTVVAKRIKDRILGVRPDQASDDTMVGPVYRVDVRSMYPAILRDREYPVSLVRYSERWTVDDLQSLVRRYGVVADVDVSTDVPEYPHRSGDRVLYPVGDFRTVLCGPELSDALKHNRVKRVWRAANYELGRPFTAAASELCELRSEYRRNNRTGWELLAKTLANSLAGKLAQNPRGWQEVPEASHYPAWDVWFCRDTDTGTTRRFRCIAGRVYEYKDIGVGQGCLTACFAFLTSYGRWTMRSYRESCPPLSVLSQDTDGLWVTASGLSALRSAGALPEFPSPGQLRLVEQTLEGYWLGPRHYCTSLGWTLSGYRSPVVSRSLLVRDTFDVNPVRAGCTEPPTTLRHISRTGKLPSPPPARLIDGSGWAIPVRLPEPIDPPRHFPPPDDPEPDD